ncbi:T-cell immunomodulatory protein [Lates japonicus]|uniref:T-cell immunomodulatory protein n=1 Tax=Lates japonicus TaxID=270547 RepID=A0AAD3MLA2_LATJO|nr:T-cell immunomodulatory protein [Lates japonicus]
MLLQWVPALSDFKWRETVWSFERETQPTLAPAPCDYNSDVLPDALVVLLRNTSRTYVDYLAPEMKIR